MLLFSLLFFTIGLTHKVGAGGSAARIYQGDDNSTSAATIVELSENDMRRLTFVKLGIALGMFVLTAAACGLPLLVMACIARRAAAATHGRTDSAVNAHAAVANAASTSSVVAPASLPTRGSVPGCSSNSSVSHVGIAFAPPQAALSFAI